MSGKETVYRLQSCVWEITLACCFSCRYCGSGAGRARENELDTAECLSVAEQLAELGCRRVSLIGGEVFMRSDWREIVRALTDRNIRVSIITNGFIVSETLIEELRQSSIESVAVSIDGPEHIHDRYRQRGSFRQAIAAIGMLVRGGIPVSVITTLHKENAAYLEDMYEIFRGRKISAWQLQACSPMGNAGSGDFDPAIEFDDVIRFVEHHAETAGFAVGIADNIGYYSESEGMLRGNLSGKACFDGCRAGLTSIGIDSVGNVRGCESMYDERFIEGNLRERRLEDIWNDPDAFAYNRRFTTDMLTGECAECHYGYICAGGCRSYNYFAGGKLYESASCVRTERRGAKTFVLP